MKIKLQAGFTLIELMIVVAIIGIIATVGWPMYLDQGRTNNRTDAIIATNAVHLALTTFESDAGGFAWASPPGVVTAANAHNRYKPNAGIPGPGIGLASGNPVTDNICTTQRGFRWVPGNARYESCRGNYSIVVALAGVLPSGLFTTYTITTSAILGRAQNRDPVNQDHDHPCISFTLNNNGVRGHIATGDSLILQPAPASDGNEHSTRRCWTSS